MGWIKVYWFGLIKKIIVTVDVELLSLIFMVGKGLDEKWMDK